MFLERERRSDEFWSRGPIVQQTFSLTGVRLYRSTLLWASYTTRATIAEAVFVWSVFLKGGAPSPQIRRRLVNFVCIVFVVCLERFYGSPPPKLFFDEIAGFWNQLPAVSPTIRCPLPPRRHRSMALWKMIRKIREDILSPQPFRCWAAMKRSLKKNAVWGGGRLW